VVAIWGYERMVATTPAIQAVFDDFDTNVIGSYWPPQRVIVEEGYRPLDFPFEEIAPRPFELKGAFTAATLARHVGTWSATNRLRQQKGEDPVPAFQRALERVWPSPEWIEPVRWPGAMRVGLNR
jgi:hypothetical protein